MPDPIPPQMPPAKFAYLYPQTEASTVDQQQPFPSDQYDSITVAADNLAGVETVQLRSWVNGHLKQVTDIYGTAINLSLSTPAVALEGGISYVFIKSITVGLCGIFVYPKQK